MFCSASSLQTHFSLTTFLQPQIRLCLELPTLNKKLEEFPVAHDAYAIASSRLIPLSEPYQRSNLLLSETILSQVLHFYNNILTRTSCCTRRGHVHKYILSSLFFDRTLHKPPHGLCRIYNSHREESSLHSIWSPLTYIYCNRLQSICQGFGG